MTKIVPAILAKTNEEYYQKLSVVKKLTNRFQLDIIDGVYVDNKTIELNDVTKLNELNMDIHLMVKEPKKYIEKAIAMRANNIIIQYDCCDDIEPYLVRIKKSGLNAGISINPSDSLKKIKQYDDLLDHVLLMAYPAGFAGQKLDPVVFDRLNEARKIFPTQEIALDGGVNKSNAKKVLQAGFDVVNINSLIFENEDPLSAYSELLGYLL